MQQIFFSFRDPVDKFKIDTLSLGFKFSFIRLS